MADLANLRIAVDSRQVVQAEKDLNKLGQAGNRAEGAANGLANATRGLGSVLAGIGIGLGVTELIRMADAYTSMQSKIRLVTSSQAELEAVQGRLFTIAQASRTEFESTGELYARLARSADALGVSQEQVLQVTEAINKATVVSGATATEANAAIIQLSQGFASGTLRGEELNSVLEQTPRVAQMIAEGMGISVGQLREFGKQGKLTSEQVFNALLRMKNSVDDEFAQMDVTVGQSITVLRNAVVNLVGTFNTATGITSGLANVIVTLANNLDVLAAAAGVLVVRLVAVKAAMAVGYVTAYMRSIVALEMALGATSTRMALFSAATKYAQMAVRALTGTMMVNPFVAVATAVAALIALLYSYRDSNVAVAGETIRLGDVFLGVWEVVKRAIAFVQRLFTDGWAEAFAFVSPALRSVGEFFGNVFTYIGNLVRTYINSWTGLFVGLGRAIKAVFTEEGVVDAFRSGLGVDYVGAFGNAVGGAIVGLANLGRNARSASNETVDLTRSTRALTTATNGQSDADEKANREREQAIKSAQDYIDGLKQAAAEIGKNAIQLKEMEINARAAAAPTAALAEETRRYGAALVEAMRGDIVTQQRERLEVLQEEVDLYWASSEAIAEANAIREAEKQGLIEGTEAWNEYVAAARQIAGLEETKAGLDAINQALEEAKQLTFDINFDAVFGDFGKALGGLLDGLNRFADAQETINQALRAGNLTIEEQLQLQMTSFRNQINGYGNMAAAAKGFFKEGSDGYKALQAAETAFRAVELAMAVQSAATKIGLITAETSAVVAGEATKTGATVAGEVSRTGAFLAQAAIRIPIAIAEGAAKMFAALGPAGFAAVAGMVAVMAGFGFGAGGGSSTLEPTNEGKGTVFGDLEKQSESITRSLKTLSQVDTATMRYSAQMAASLRNIEASIGGVTNVLLRTNGLQNMAANANVGYGGITNTISGVFNTAGKVLSSNITTGIAAGLGFFAGGPIGAIAMALGTKLVGGIASLVGKLFNTLFGSKTTIVGQGIFGAGQDLASILSEGFQAQYYTDLKTKKKFFGITTSTKYKTEFSAADEEINRQFSLIFKSIYDSVLAAAVPLGMTTDAITDRLNDFVVEIGKIETKGLTGEQIQEKLTAVFGAAADKIAEAAIPGLEKFQKVGEGYFETLVRVASAMEQVNTMFQFLGRAAVSLDVGMAIVDLFGSAADFVNKTSEYFSAYYTEAEQVAAITAQMARVFENLGLQTPTTLAGFRALVEAQDLTTDAGRQTYAALLDLAPAFADFIKRQQELNEEIGVANNATTSLVSSLQDFTVAANDNTVAATAAAAANTDLADAEAFAEAAQDRLVAAAQAVLDLANSNTASVEQTTAANQEMAAAITQASEAQNLLTEATRIAEVANQDLVAATVLASAVQIEYVDAVTATVVANENLVEAAVNAAAAQETLNEVISEGTKEALELAKKRRSLEIELLIAQGREAEATAAKRADELAATDELLRPLQLLIWATEDAAAAYEREAGVLKDTAKKFRDIGDALRSFSGDLTSLIRGTDTASASLQEQFNRTAALARIGNVEAMERLPELGRDLAEMVVENAPDRLSMIRQLAAIQQQTDAAAVVADRQASIAERQLAALDKQGGALIAINENTITVAAAVRQLVALNGGTPTASSTASAALTTPTTVYDSNQVQTSNSNASLSAEINAMRSEVNVALFQIAKNTGKTADQLQRWDGDGLPEERNYA